MTEAERITRVLNGRWSGQSGIACCPAHEDKHPSLSLANGNDGRLLLTCHSGCGFSEILNALRQFGLLAGRVSGQSCPLPKAPALVRNNRSVLAERIWDSALPIRDTLAERYLIERGITCRLAPALRYLRDCRHPSGQHLPALVSKVEGADGFAIHRTYLSNDGRAKTADLPAKAMLGPTRGGAVALANNSGPLVVAEGIETALSLLCGFITKPARVLAALSAGGIEHLRLPEKPGELMIATDGDKRGRDAGHHLAKRAHVLGWKVSMLPAPEGADWNDVLMEKVSAR